MILSQIVPLLKLRSYHQQLRQLSHQRNKEGEVVEVSYNLRGRRWEAQDGTIKYFNTIEAWTMSLTAQAPIEKLTKTMDLESNDDLPF